MGVNVKRIFFILALCIFLTSFVRSENFTFSSGELVVGPYSRVYRIQERVTVSGSDKASAIKEYISSHQKDGDFNSVFKRLDKDEECTHLRNLSQNYEFDFKEGDNPWTSKSFWKAYFYIDPCAFSVAKELAGNAYDWTIEQAGIKLGWVFGVNTFGGKIKPFPFYVLVALGVFLFIFLVHLVFGNMSSTSKGIYGGVFSLFVIYAFVIGLTRTKNTVFAFLCLIFFTTMIVLQNYSYSRQYFVSNSGFFNLIYLTIKYSVFSVFPHTGEGLVSRFQKNCYRVILLFFIAYPFLAAIPVLNVFLSIITLEVLFAPLFWRALLLTFILFFAVQVWPMYSKYQKRQAQYKKAMEEVLAREAMKSLARA